MGSLVWVKLRSEGKECERRVMPVDFEGKAYFRKLYAALG